MNFETQEMVEILIRIRECKKFEWLAVELLMWADLLGTRGGVFLKMAWVTVGR